MTGPTSTVELTREDILARLTAACGECLLALASLLRRDDPLFVSI